MTSCLDSQLQRPEGHFIQTVGKKSWTSGPEKPCPLATEIHRQDLSFNPSSIAVYRKQSIRRLRGNQAVQQFEQGTFPEPLAPPVPTLHRNFTVKLTLF